MFEVFKTYAQFHETFLFTISKNDCLKFASDY